MSKELDHLNERILSCEIDFKSIINYLQNHNIVQEFINQLESDDNLLIAYLKVHKQTNRLLSETCNSLRSFFYRLSIKLKKKNIVPIEVFSHIIEYDYRYIVNGWEYTEARVIYDMLRNSIHQRFDDLLVNTSSELLLNDVHMAINDLILRDQIELVPDKVMYTRGRKKTGTKITRVRRYCLVISESPSDGFSTMKQFLIPEIKNDINNRIVEI